MANNIRQLGILVIFASLCYGQAIKGGQVVIAGSGTISVFSTQSITVIPLTIGAPIGGTQQFSAIYQDSIGNTSPACTSSGWASSSPGIATINASTGLATGVSAGTTTITCSGSSLVGTGTLIVETAPNFTTPSLPCSNPCALSPGSTGVAYLYTLVAGGGTAPYVFSTTAGSLPTGLNLAPSGAITGTPTTGGSAIFTVQVCDSLGACGATLQASILIASGCGPPVYACSSTSAALATIPPLPNMGGSTGVNTTGYEYSSPTDFYYPVSGKGNCITRLTDNSSIPTHLSFNSTWSGGGNDLMWSTDRSYGAVMSTGAGTYYVSVSYDVNGCMQLNNPVLSTLSPGGTQGGFTFSRTVRNRAFHINGSSGNGTILNQEDLSGTNPVVITATTPLFDFAHCPGVPSVRPVQPVGGNGQLHVSSDDDVFMTSLNMSTVTGQGNAHWVLAWKRSTNQCAAYYTGQVLTTENPANGNTWAYCGPGDCSQGGSNPAPLGLNTTCAQPGAGMHGTQGFKDGLYTVSTHHCNGSVNSYNHWKIGTNEIATCTGDAPQTFDCGGHNTAAYHRHFMRQNEYNWRVDSDITTFTNFAIGEHTGGVDFHGSAQWVGSAADNGPWLVSNQMNALTPCNPALKYCGELEAIPLTGHVVRFAYTFWQTTGGLGPISTMTQDGYCMIFQSDWNQSLGLDNTGHARRDVFSICNLQ